MNFVVDSSILIDMLDIDLLDEFYQLELRAYITSSVANELAGDFNADRIQEDIDDERLVFYELTESDQNRIMGLTSSTPSRLSEPDLSCLWLAIRIKATLLTCEKLLSNTARRKMGVQVHGSLWVFDRLVDEKIITKKTAYRKLVRLMSINTRLPKSECDKRLSMWK